jgi:long-chain acyl-CoA synthetase
MNTADYLLEIGRNQDLVLITNKARHTYQDLRQASARLAGELEAAGVGPFARVGIFANNSLFWVTAYLAAMKLGAVAVPFATTLMPDTVSTMERFVSCKVMCIEKRIHDRFASALPNELTLIFDDVLERHGPSTWPSTPIIGNMAQDAALMFTSGTTASPRAVQVSHRNIQANTESIINYLTLERADRMMDVLPFYYCFGTSLLHTHLRVGGSLALCNTFAYPETAVDMIETTECTGLAGVPSTYQTLLRNSTFPNRRFKTLHKIQQAGGKLSPVLIKELMAALPDATIYIMYGQTEATARLSYLPPNLLESKLGSIGKDMPGVELRVVGESGSEVKPGEIGEIIARGDNICKGYLNEPEATAQKFVDGALHTGDLATVDEDVFIYIVDRKSDFIKPYGYRVSSQQIENCVLELPDVVAAAAIGEPDLVCGEAIKVFAVLRTGSPLTPEDIIAHCGQHIPRYMVPKAVVIVTQLPMNSAGKIVKAELRKLTAPAVGEPTNKLIPPGA